MCTYRDGGVAYANVSGTLINAGSTLCNVTFYVDNFDQVSLRALSRWKGFPEGLLD